jgi:hypothetical protein
VLSSGSWLGAGRWLDLTYLHLGTYLSTATRAARFGSADICATSRFCGFVPWGQLALYDDGSVRRVMGAWSEEWYLRHPAAGWRPQPLVARFTGLD